jgi:hypothetical protein
MIESTDIALGALGGARAATQFSANPRLGASASFQRGLNNATRTN